MEGQSYKAKLNAADDEEVKGYSVFFCIISFFKGSSACMYQDFLSTQISSVPGFGSLMIRGRCSALKSTWNYKCLEGEKIDFLKSFVNRVCWIQKLQWRNRLVRGTYKSVHCGAMPRLWVWASPRASWFTELCRSHVHYGGLMFVRVIHVHAFKNVVLPLSVASIISTLN